MNLVSINGELYHSSDFTEDELSHFGVKGMKWGKRKARGSGMSDRTKRNLKRAAIGIGGAAALAGAAYAGHRYGSQAAKLASRGVGIAKTAGTRHRGKKMMKDVQGYRNAVSAHLSGAPAKKAPATFRAASAIKRVSKPVVNGPGHAAAMGAARGVARGVELGGAAAGLAKRGVGIAKTAGTRRRGKKMLEGVSGYRNAIRQYV